MGQKIFLTGLEEYKNDTLFKRGAAKSRTLLTQPNLCQLLGWIRSV